MRKAREKAFGSQFAMSTTEQNLPCQWSLDMRKGKDVAMGIKFRRAT